MWILSQEQLQMRQHVAKTTNCFVRTTFGEKNERGEIIFKNQCSRYLHYIIRCDIILNNFRYFRRWLIVKKQNISLQDKKLSPETEKVLGLIKS